MSRGTALVLGATGYIGGAIAQAAADGGWRVRGLRRRAGSEGNTVGLPIDWFDGDLAQPATLSAAFKGADVVFDAAGYYPQRTAPVAQHVVVGVRQARLRTRGGARVPAWLGSSTPRP